MHTSAPPSHTTTAAAVRRVRALLVGLVAAVAGLVGVVAVPSTAHAAADTAPVASSFDTQVLAATNVQRKRHGLRPLRMMSCPDRYATSWTQFLASRDAFYHQSLTPILKACGLRGAGENLAWRSGSLSATQVVDMWMKSPGHRRNILNGRFRYLGVDAWRSTDTNRIYAGQVFGA
ncbi:hypothetical protein ASG49_02840 [Marmoricola sp. Leaf446]|uniref:CAP domain-containing protein n=1 Tax=Marmoricola sp. Leaf446 TaxID=1736379 RepID=UPI0006FE3E48|nr:CAP domain-containing protein [Marmoricola sp. Leaf446]KQT93904.1 hypothetical protein ASG49_02840 [Marmoricola sp. Leaf446]